MFNSKKTFALFAAALFAASTVADAAFARQISQNGSGKTRKELEDDGYSCVRVSVNFIECTKNGSKTYWCDDFGTCEPAPRKAMPGTNGAAAARPTATRSR